ncbi:hypothetical protein ACF3NT_07525 [Naumannella halotolerans]|uniref:hypothetical protein n=1 Tax=Naumannella halotolerans TaxID=993414 RepID=UPI00370D57E4
MRVRFTGEITGIGSASGIRVVVGNWATSPFGTVADAMVETAAGHRILIAPTPELAEFIAETYVFDEVRVEPTAMEMTEHGRRFRSDSLQLGVELGERTILGWLIALIPHRIATAPAWCAVTDPIARLLMRGVRTRGTAGGGRREWYGATEVRAVESITGQLDGRALRSLRPVEPPCRFGFSSTPTTPSITQVVTTIELR